MVAIHIQSEASNILSFILWCDFKLIILLTANNINTLDTIIFMLLNMCGKKLKDNTNISIEYVLSLVNPFFLLIKLVRKTLNKIHKNEAENFKEFNRLTSALKNKKWIPKKNRSINTIINMKLIGFVFPKMFEIIRFIII